VPADAGVAIDRAARQPKLGETLPDEEIYPAHLPGQTLADLIAGRGDNPAPGEPAARTVEFLEAAYRSAEEHRPVRTDELVG
jgi:predicted dehydrogenase